MNITNRRSDITWSPGQPLAVREDHDIRTPRDHVATSNAMVAVSQRVNRNVELGQN